MWRTVATVVVVGFLFGGAADAEDVSRVPPKTYAERLAPLLTPAREVLDHRFDKGGPTGSEVGLLYETVRFVDDSGRSCVAVHQIDMARDDQGVNDVAKDVFPYRKTDQKIHLVLAQSVQADGSFQKVEPSAVLIQTPQSESDSSLYSDYAELVVIYPNVRPNTACESIVVTEDEAARVPGEYTGTLRFEMGIAEARMRHIVAMSPQLAGHLNITPLGSTPIPQRLVTRDGTVQLTWEAKNIPAMQNEPQRAPDDQAGPAIFLTTLKDWAAFGDWYRTLLKGRDRAEKELAREVAERTHGLTDRDAIVTALLTDAARDVRYTGLEFGVAGFQPHDPNEVWANRYGDCKDKANLLRVMLREKNIPAELALVNTEHAGRIEKRSPDFRHFDHMIVAVNKAEGGFTFCDPTIKYAVPGMLRPDDTDRDILVLNEKGAEFVHTPAQNVGDLRYDFDLKLAADGSLSGWLTIEATGYTGASVGEYYSVKEKQLARSRTHDLLQGFYRSAELVDVEPMPMEKYSGTYRLRAYFTQAGDGAPLGRETLSFPGTDSLLPDLGDRKAQARQTLYWQSRLRRIVRCRIQLPSAWGLVDPPRPFSIAADVVAATAGWISDGGAVVASLDYVTLRNQVTVEQYPLLYNAVASLRSWITKPVTVAVARPGGVNVSTTAPATQPELADFPLMPTGEGQLDLLDRKFPADRDVVQRREALERVLQWFPDDKETRFIAQVHLLELDELASPMDALVVDRMRQLLATSRDLAEPNSLTWGEYLLGRWLTAAGNKPEALTIFARLAGDVSVPDARRSWASYRGAKLVDADDPSKAIKLLESTLDLDTDLLPAQFSELAPLLLKRREAAKLEALLDSLAGRLPGQLDKVISGLVDDAKQYADDDSKRHDAGELLGVLDRIVAANPGLAHLREQVDQTRTRVSTSVVYADAAADLKAYLGGHHPAWWDSITIDKTLKTREQLLGAVKRAGATNPLEPYVRYSLEYLTRLPPDPADFGERLWRLASALNAYAREPDLYNKLLDLLDQLPASDRWHWEGDLFRAKVLADGGHVPEAVAVLRSLGDNTKAIRPYRWSAYRIAGEYLERVKRFDDALSFYKLIESDLSANNRNCEGLLRAIFLNLERGARPEALRLCGVLSRVAVGDRDASPNAAQMRELIGLAGDPVAAQKFWKRQESWWPMWLAIARNIGAPSDDEPLVPLVPDLYAAGQQIGLAARAGDPLRLFKTYSLVVHAARWEPKFLAEWAGVIQPAIETIPQQQTELRRLVVQALDGLDVADPAVMARSKVLLAAYLIDTNRAAESLPVIKAYLASSPPNDANRQAMHRLWSYVAPEGPELNGAIASLQEDLDSPQGVADRPRTIVRLADTYRRLRARDKEVALLQHELSNTVIKADAANDQLLAARYQALVKPQTDGADAFSKGVTRWMARNKPNWYDFAQPGSLKDLAGQDLDRLLDDPPKTMLPAETAKIGFLIAQDSSQPMARRTHAFDIAVWKLTQLSTRHDEFAKLGVSILNDADFSDKSRSYWLYAVLQDGTGIPGKSILRLHRLYNTLSAEQHQQLDSAQLWGVDEDSAGSLEQFAAEALAAPLNPTTLAQFDRAFNRLMQLSPEAAKRVYQRTQNLAVAPGVTESAPAVRLRLLRSMRQADATDATQRAVAKMVLDHYESRHLQPPDDWREYRELPTLELLDRQTALAIELQVVRTHRFSASFGFWIDLLRSADISMQDTQFRAELLKAFLTLDSSDEDRRIAILVSTSILDIDQPAQREQLLALVAPYRDPIRNPLAAGAVRELEASVALRDGKPVDLDAVYRGPQTALMAMFESEQRLVALYQLRDPAAIRRVLGAANTNDLLSGDHLPMRLQALRMAGMNDEADLVREAGLRELYRATLRAWSYPNDQDIRGALTLAVALDATGQLSQAWVNDCLSHVQNDDLKDNIIMMWAELHHDWAGALEAANRLIALQPTHFIYYWHRGNALFQIGQKSEAAAALTTYVHYCKDEAQYPDALELLGKMRGK